MVGGPDADAVGQTQTKVITHLEKLGLQVPAEKVQFPSPQVKFLGTWWKGRAVCIHPKILTTLEQIKMSESKKELQHALSVLVFWRKHILDFLIIAYPLYDLTCKRATWEWTLIREEALKLLVFEAGTYQALGSVHPSSTPN